MMMMMMMMKIIMGTTNIATKIKSKRMRRVEYVTAR
jgi:hypothetical protein